MHALRRTSLFRPSIFRKIPPIASSSRPRQMSSETPAKKFKMTGPLIGTHNGHFHADEALAVYLLRLLPTYSSSPLVRTRDPAVLATCHTVVDVGGVYDSSINRYDHHQREFSTVYPNHTTTLSSAGLVYLHFGKAIIAQQTGLEASSEDVAVLHEKLYTDLIEAFDANDNGISQFAASEIAKAGIKKKFEDRGFSIASVVGRYNHAPLPTSFSDTAPQAEEDARFARASEFTGEQFVIELTNAHKSWLPARALVTQAYNERLHLDVKGRIMMLPYRKEGIPWSDHLYGLEKASAPQPDVQAQVLYVLFPENGDEDTKWRIRAVSKEGSGFENRKDLPDAWKGVRDEKLVEVSGIPGCIFVHASGFIGGNKTFQGALAMAQFAVDA